MQGIKTIQSKEIFVLKSNKYFHLKEIFVHFGKLKLTHKLLQVTINQRIKDHLDKENFDVKKIPEIIDMSWKMVKSYVEGDSIPSLKLISWLFKEFQYLNPQWLFFGDGERIINSGKNDDRELEILRGRIAELEHKFDAIKPLLKEQRQLAKEISKERKELDLEGIIKKVIKEYKGK